MILMKYVCKYKTELKTRISSDVEQKDSVLSAGGRT